MRNYSLADRLDASVALLRRIPLAYVSGTVVNLYGLLVEVDGLSNLIAIGDRLNLRARDDRIIPAEVIGFRNRLAQVMAFAPLDGLGPGAKAELLTRYHGMLDVASSWLGRIIDPLCDHSTGTVPYSVARCLDRRVAPLPKPRFVPGWGPVSISVSGR